MAGRRDPLRAHRAHAEQRARRGLRARSRRVRAGPFASRFCDASQQHTGEARSRAPSASSPAPRRRLRRRRPALRGPGRPRRPHGLQPGGPPPPPAQRRRERRRPRRRAATHAPPASTAHLASSHPRSCPLPPTAAAGRARCRELLWGSEEHARALLEESPGGFDLVLGADVIYPGSQARVAAERFRSRRRSAQPERRSESEGGCQPLRPVCGVRRATCRT